MWCIIHTFVVCSVSERLHCLIGWYIGVWKGWLINELIGLLFILIIWLFFDHLLSICTTFNHSM